MQPMKLKAIGAFLILFGAITIFAGSSVLLDLFGMRAKQGNYVPFVVAANVICGFLYLFAAFGLFHAKKYSYTLMAIASILLILTFIALIIFIFSGGIYEVKTFNVMTIRIIITVGLTVWIRLLLSINKNNS
jgi:hypothetical protein